MPLGLPIPWACQLPGTSMVSSYATLGSSQLPSPPSLLGSVLNSQVPSSSSSGREFSARAGGGAAQARNIANETPNAFFILAAPALLPVRGFGLSVISWPPVSASLFSRFGGSHWGTGVACVILDRRRTCVHGGPLFRRPPPPASTPDQTRGSPMTPRIVLLLLAPALVAGATTAREETVPPSRFHFPATGVHVDAQAVLLAIA